MECRRLRYGNDITIDIAKTKNIKIPEAAINKALMIAMNYLLENMETTEQESAE